RSRRVERIELRGAEEARQVGAAKLAQRRHPRPLQERPQRRLVGALARSQEAPRLDRQPLEVHPAKLGVGAGVARPPQIARELVLALQRVAVERVHARLEQLVASPLEGLATLRVGLVGLHDGDASKRDRPLGPGYLERRLEPGQLLGQLVRLAPQEPVEREPEELAEAPSLIPARGRAELAQLLHLGAVEEARVAGVDRLDLQLLLVARALQVELPSELLRERLGLRAIGLEIHPLAR